MTNRKWMLGAAFAAASLAAAGCGSTVGAVGEDTTPDEPGQEAVPGVVRIVKIDRLPDGSAAYTLENVSGQLQEDLSYQIEFVYPPSSKGAIQIRSDRVFSPERDLVLLKSDTAKVVPPEHAEPNPRPDQKVITTRLHVREDPPVAAVARTGNEAGTGSVFVSRTLECVGMADEDSVRAGKLWIEVENVSPRPATDLQARAVFRDIGDNARKVAETRWVNMHDVAPGQRGRVEFDLTPLGNVAHYTLLVKIRQKGF